MRTCLFGRNRSTGRLASLLVLITALMACALPQTASAEPTWALQSPANPVAQTKVGLEGVSCPSSTICVGVGNDAYTGTGPVEVWSGGEWKTVKTAGTPLKSVSCVSTVWCMTVAKSGSSASLLKYEEVFKLWELTAKNPSAPAGATQVVFNGVSCTSTTACTAVGSYRAESGVYKTLVDRWNGTTWSQQTAVSPAEGAREMMLAVSCSDASTCMTVGTRNGVPVSEQWTAAKWTERTPALPEGAAGGTLEGVSCTEASCMAVGNFHEKGGSDQALAEEWNGVSWSVLFIGDPTETKGNVELHGVSCASSTACYTVGTYVTKASGGIAEEEKTLVQTWNAAEHIWSIQASPNPTGSKFSVLAGVSCSSATACTAVGATYPVALGGEAKTLGERWNGTAWSLQSTVNPTAVTEVGLEGVSCGSASMCMGVGTDNYRGKGVVEVWGGTEWKIVSTLSAGANAVSCASATWCMTVARNGSAAWSLKEEPVFKTWGATEKALSIPAGATEIVFNGVSCTSTTACTAVGSYRAESGVYKTLVDRWNGTTWSQQTAVSPAEGAREMMLAVSCSDASTCMTVGTRNGVPVSEQWTAAKWTERTPALPEGAAGGTLEGVSCTEASCMAVGNFHEKGGSDQALAEEWNGVSWSVLFIGDPTETKGNVELHGVSCASSTACYTVGTYVTKATGGIAEEEKTLVQTWNAAEHIWSIQASPNPTGSKFSVLAGVSCSSATACTAVGAQYPGNLFGEHSTLAERYE